MIKTGLKICIIKFFIILSLQPVLQPVPALQFVQNITEQSLKTDFLLQSTMIMGYVYDNTTSNTIENATIDVYIDNNYFRTTYTNTTGYYELEVDAGNLYIFVYATAHAPAEYSTAITEGEVLSIDFYLDEDTVPPLILNVELNIFENISFLNPLRIKGTIIENHSMSRTVYFGKYLNSTDAGWNYIMVHAFSNQPSWIPPTDDLYETHPYPHTYNFSIEWRANIYGGWIADLNTQEYIVYNTYMQNFAVVIGYYYNSTAPQTFARAMFYMNGDLFGIYSAAINDFVDETDITGRFSPIWWCVTTDKTGRIINSTLIQTSWLIAAELRIISFQDFAQSGVYLIWIATDDWGYNFADETYLVTVDTEPPVANVNITPEQPVAQGTIVVFDATSSIDNVGIINYTWSFKYNGLHYTLYGSRVAFPFDITGTYKITLQIWDGGYNTDTAIAYVVVFEDTEPPVANAGPDITINQHETVFLDAGRSTDNGRIVNYSWYFMYNNTPTLLFGERVQFTFHTADMYEVILNVTDVARLYATDLLVITVCDITPPIACAGPDIIINQHETAIFNASLSEDNVDIVNYTWTFIYDNDTVLLYGMIASFTFHDAGVYEVTLNVTDTAGNFGIDILKVIVQDTEPPVARAGSDIVINQHETVIFNASLSTDNVAILTYTWTFIYDNTQITLSGRIVEFVFHNAGDYKITLNVTDAAGNFGIDELNVTVIDIEPPIANAGSDIIISLYGTAIFNASLSKDNVGIVNYTWTFIYDDEQITLYGMCTSFTFETIGIYTITLNVTDAAGNFGIDTVNVTVIDTTPPDISHSPIKEWVEGTPITVVAVVTDNVAVKDVILYYRLGGDAEYKSIKMVQEKGKNVWSVVIPSAEVKGDALDYYIIAYDTFGNIAEYPSDGEKKPIRIDLKKAFVLPIEFLIAFGIIGVCMIVFTISKIRMHKRMQKKKKFK